MRSQARVACTLLGGEVAALERRLAKARAQASRGAILLREQTRHVHGGQPRSPLKRSTAAANALVAVSAAGGGEREAKARGRHPPPPPPPPPRSPAEGGAVAAALMAVAAEAETLSEAEEARPQPHAPGLQPHVLEAATLRAQAATLRVQAREAVRLRASGASRASPGAGRVQAAEAREVREAARAAAKARRSVGCGRVGCGRVAVELAGAMEERCVLRNKPADIQDVATASGCHTMPPGCHRMYPGCRPMCPGARCTTSSGVPAWSGACSPPSWAASTKHGRGSPGRGCAPASHG